LRRKKRPPPLSLPHPSAPSYMVEEPTLVAPLSTPRQRLRDHLARGGDVGEEGDQG
jgi:hypothetical protein